jgi:hypothetical protein
MKNRNVMLNIVILSGISLLITVAVYFLNVLLLSSSENLSPINAFFFEGVIFLLFGVLLLLGRGGINLWSVRAAILSAFAEAVYDADTVGPSETLKADRWKPKGFNSIALILMLAGVFMILIYFLNL